MSTLDKSKIKPIPVQKTLTLVNNFVLNTVAFLNTFTETVENKISSTSNKITQLEILLSVLEAKLNSIPGLESTVSTGETTSAPTAPSNNTAAPTTNTPIPSTTTDIEVAMAATAPPAIDEAYAPFMKMIKVGIPRFVAQAKAAAAGLDPSVLENYNP